MINEVVEAISDPFICLDQDRRIVCTNRAARDLFGDDLGPEGLCGTLGAAVDPALGRARRTSGQLPFSVEVPDADGVPKRHSGLVRRVGGAQLKGFALRLHDQESNRFGLLTRQIDRLKQEVRARKAAQEKAEAAAAAQRASEARFRALIEATAQTVWTTNASGSITEDSPSWRSFTGQSVDEWLGDGWINAVHPDDRQPTMANWRLAVAERRAVEVDYRVRRSDGEWRWMTARSVPVFEEDGTLAGYVGMNSDITERKLDEQHRELLIRELNHRVKNSLAVIQAMALQTIRHTKDLDEFKKAYIGRLNAMASSHDLLVNGEDRGVRLDGLIRRQLAPHICNPAQLAIRSRTRVDIDADTAHSLGLVLHELATNAVKYGALSRSDGVIEIAWRTSREMGEEMATLTWRERNGPAISTPSRKGFGTTLIETTLSHTLGGSGEIRYEPEGVVASLSFPVGGSDG